MTPLLYVANSSPIIVFERVGQSALLHNLLQHVNIPPAVRHEVFGPDLLPDWIEERIFAQPLASDNVRARLGPGEVGSLGLLLRAKDKGLMSAVRLLMVAMQGDDFRIADELFADILKAAGES
ncbi:MAG: DUF3368 domain-containing protein [Chloroflexi bacterium]|nr:DUF3368 domain-containing protein [Chloroflexota bacterium]